MDLDMHLTREQEEYCRKWLRSFYKAEAQLTNQQLFPKFYLLGMLQLELKDRKRIKVIKRLEARFNALRREQERKMLNLRYGKEIWNYEGESN